MRDIFNELKERKKLLGKWIAGREKNIEMQQAHLDDNRASLGRVNAALTSLDDI